MAEVIRMPRMSDTMEEGNIVGWLKQEGDQVEAGETLAEVETDKATMELDSFTDGVLLHIAVKEGPVPINGVIAVIGQQGEDWKKAIEEAGNGAESASESEEKKDESPAPKKERAKSDQAPAPAADSSPKEEEDEQRLKASPLARSMAKEAGIDLKAVKGSGDGGRIVRRDIEAAMETKAAPAEKPADKKVEAPAGAPFAFSGADNFEDFPVSQMRKTIARRLGESKFSAPHFYLTVEINMDKAIALRQRINEVAPVKISFNDLVIKAVAAALRRHPAVNSSWLGDKIRRHNDVHIGVAVAVDEGLLVPVVRHADMKTLSQINIEVKAMAGKAKDRKLTPEEMQGNTFTISNLGMFGIEEFTAIINPPDACILAVGGIVEKAIVKDGQVVPGNQMKVTLSCDHRVVDGATGAQFLQTFKEILEDPIRLMI
jgi:pyruvate dehydrogenase E2 component (dihydrolipoamide acetyltransferase)